MSNSNTIFKKSDFYPKGVLISKLNNIAKDIINILYTDLYTLRSESKLVPGQSYRIIDYVCTTITVDTRSAGNQFDIIVEALDENTLSENASAVQHDGDTYFTNAKLESWELKYCLDNNTSRFAWANSVNGKGVIYYMKDNYNNELPYDFKNIQYLKNSVWVYTFGGTTDNSLSVVCSNNIINPYISSNKQTLNNITFGTSCYSNTFGVNCQSNTFGTNCSSNTFGAGCYSNTFRDGCNSNIFGDGCYYNIFSNDCRSSTFGGGCYSNTFGDECVSNTFGTNCRYNTFGHFCSLNTFGNSCDANTFGDSWRSNTFGNNCSSNKFGRGCYSTTFGINCSSNTFDDWCYSNTFGDYCQSNTFGYGCYSNKFYHGSSGTTKKNYIRYIVLEDGVRNNNFYSNTTTSSTSYLQRIRIKGLEHTTQTDITITLPATNTDYEWVVAKDSDGVVQQYCPENLVDAPSDDKTYGRKNGDWSEIVTSGGGGASTISITWSALKSLRDTGTLVSGQSYRITDYVCTTTTADSQAVNNLFDIVVTALDEGRLLENASATYHEGDTYFTNANLEAWELKYCVDNDTTRFAWTDTVNGKGVIYYMKDEWGNECPYDFKNIQYSKNSVWLYTFGGTLDNSLMGGCHHNTIMDYVLSSVLRLNFNTFGNNCYYNKFGNNCYSNTFGSDCSSNKFGNNFRSNTLGNWCYYNTFGNWCTNNTFGDNYSSNTLGDSCTYNTFGLVCSSNTFGDSCTYNTFGDRFYYNTFGDNCTYNNFYHGTSGTTKKVSVRYIVLEDGCSKNNFYSELTTSSTSYLQRIRIKGLEHTTQTNTQIDLLTANTNYDWVIGKNSSGTIKQYCPEDLVP